MTTIYTYEHLKQLKGQAVKDIWHNMIGKEAGIRNTTGLKTMEDIFEAILRGQEDPEFLATFTGNSSPQLSKEQPERKMPPKAKQTALVTLPKKHTLAVESEEPPQKNVEVKRICVRRLFFNGFEYFLNPETKDIYRVQGGFPGEHLGTWNAAERTITPREE